MALEHLFQALSAVVFDHHARAWREVGLDIRVHPAEDAGGHAQPAVVETTRNGLALDQELDFEAGQQDLIEHPDGQLRLTDGETPHRVFAPVQGDTLDIRSKRPLYASRPRRVYDRSVTAVSRRNCRRLHARSSQATRQPSLVAAPSTLARAGQPTFRTGTEIVSFGVTVSDKRANFLNDLTRDDLEIFEDGKKQTIEYFARGDAGQRRRSCTSACCSTPAAAWTPTSSCRARPRSSSSTRCRTPRT